MYKRRLLMYKKLSIIMQM